MHCCRKEASFFLINAFTESLCTGVEEVRLLQMGKATSFTDMVMELKLVHDFDHITAVNMEDLIFKDRIGPEVLKHNVIDSELLQLCLLGSSLHEQFIPVFGLFHHSSFSTFDINLERN